MGEEEEARRRLCDYCDSSVALVYCKADSAKLCLSCDKQVHVTNQLFAKHFRSLLCDSCHDSPSSVFCETEKSVLCQNCDWESHSGSSSSVVHSGRRPLEGFSGCPSVTEFLALLGVDDLSDKEGSGSGGGSEMLVWETPEIVSLNDLIGSGGSGHNFQAINVPPLPKNRHATCGKYKEEMIKQLRELAKSEPGCLKYEPLDVEFDTGFLFLAPENDNDLFSTCEMSGLKWFEGATEQDEEFPYSSMLKNMSESDNINLRCDGESTSMMVAVSEGLVNRCEEETVMVPVNTTRSILPSHEINSLERNSALSRYKEKKKSRRYEKHIRYESRKVRAESRTRIRGRFAKADP